MLRESDTHPLSLSLSLSVSVSVSARVCLFSIYAHFDSLRVKLTHTYKHARTQRQLLPWLPIRSPAAVDLRMEFLKKARTVKLRSHHGKYLWADDDECMITQSKDGSKRNALWTVELDEENTSMVKFKSCYDCYLTATNVPFLLGWTGKKVLQMKLIDSESSILWEPVRDGYSVKLKTPSGAYLRANGAVYPWRNSVTHDVPHRTATRDWVLWEVVAVQSISNDSPVDYSPPFSRDPSFSSKDSFKDEDSPTAKPKLDGRIIYYEVADDYDETPEDADAQFLFKGHDLGVLTEKLKEETGITEDIIVCSRNHINNKLYPLRLQLPPNNTPMHVVVVKAESKTAKTLQGETGGIGVDKSYSRLSSLDDE